MATLVLDTTPLSSTPPAQGSTAPAQDFTTPATKEAPPEGKGRATRKKKAGGGDAG